MAGFIMWEGRIFLLMLGLGAAYSVAYDILRILRYAIRHNNVARSAEDLLFFILMGFSAYIVFLNLADGNVRLYMIVGITAGMLAYRYTLSRIIVPFFGKLIKKLLRICSKTVKIIFNKVTRGGEGEEDV